MPETVRVALDARSYDILIGRSLLADAGGYVAPIARGLPVHIVTDTVVAGLHLQTLLQSLDRASVRTSDPIVVPAGEGAKDMAHLARVLDDLLTRGIERRTVVVALGGGVIGDLAGFAAAVALRGIGFVQIPTTLLAQVDSSVGGKTGINTRHGKNLVGAFHQPRLVLADTGVLDTLAARELRAGYAEVVKYAAIGDRAFFDWLDARGPGLLAGDARARVQAVAASCRHKAAIVAADEREAGQRALLNLGHTFGHALEAHCGYDGRLLHGEGVALGMVMAAELSVRLGLCPAEDAARLTAHLARVGLPTRPGAIPALRDATPEGLLGHMARDKKVSDGRLTFILLRGLGGAFVEREVPVSMVRDVLADALSDGGAGGGA